MFSTYRWDTANANRGGHFIRGIGRLKDGVTLEQGRAEMDTIAARLEQQYPVSNINQGVRVDPLLDSMVGGSRPVVMLLAGAVIVVLLVACANVANLLLARGTGRLRELALRAAIGADRGRLVRQMLTESAALSLLGAAGGLGVALIATRALTVLAAAGIPRADQIGIDGWVLAFAIAASLLTSVVFGLVPALHLSRQDLNDALKEGGKQQGAAVGRGAREALIVCEVALSIVLLVGAGLLIRSLQRLEGVNPGFNTEQTVSMEISLPVARYEEGDQMPFYQRLEERVQGIAGVRGVGAANILPLSSNYDSRGIQIEDNPKPDGQGQSPQSRSVTPGYFAAMGIPLIAGRNFDPRDTEDRQRVVIISESMARAYWPGVADVVGKRITYNSGIPEEQQQVVGGPGSRVVVGVVGDVKHLALDEDTVPMFYTPHTQQPSYHTMWHGGAVRGASGIADRPGARRAEPDGQPGAAVAGGHAVDDAEQDRGRSRGCARRWSACSRGWRWRLPRSASTAWLRTWSDSARRRSACGARWARRRLKIVGDAGARIDASGDDRHRRRTRSARSRCRACCRRCCSRCRPPMWRLTRSPAAGWRLPRCWRR